MLGQTWPMSFGACTGHTHRDSCLLRPPREHKSRVKPGKRDLPWFLSDTQLTGREKVRVGRRPTVTKHHSLRPTSPVFLSGIVGHSGFRLRSCREDTTENSKQPQPKQQTLNHELLGTDISDFLSLTLSIYRIWEANALIVSIGKMCVFSFSLVMLT